MSIIGLGFFRLGTGVATGICAVSDKLVVAGMMWVISSSNRGGQGFIFARRVLELGGGKFSAIFLERFSMDS
jgi:hypothetical protein